MDLRQQKVTKTEWESIEVPIMAKEEEILETIIRGYHNVQYRTNSGISTMNFLKIDDSEKIHECIYEKFFRNRCERVQKSMCILFNQDILCVPVKQFLLRSVDKVRVHRFTEKTIQSCGVYENLLLDIADQIVLTCKQVALFHKHYYTLFRLSKNSVSNLNPFVVHVIDTVIRLFMKNVSINEIIYRAVDILEENELLLRHADLELYRHQKDIFVAVKEPGPKLILYIAPTGTGKTMTPIGLSEGKRVIFVCAARHVGLALARSAIAVHKKVAFAFGCESAADIRLHYYAAKEYTTNWRSGGIWKVDNEVGDNVQIIVCDVQSYICAMYYMMAFFPLDDLVTYWDEPTITMDYETHPCHKIIHENWVENKIPTVILSSATLPTQTELSAATIPHFLGKFPDARIVNISSYDCKKTIPIVNNEGFVEMPHFLSDKLFEVYEYADHCANNHTLLRYLDLNEIIRFLKLVHSHASFRTIARYAVQNYFDGENETRGIDQVNMQSIKIYYIQLLCTLPQNIWDDVYPKLVSKRIPLFYENAPAVVEKKDIPFQKMQSVGPGVEPAKGSSSTASFCRSRSSEPSSVGQQKGTMGIYVSTRDAYTLTDGPTLFMTDDVEKIGKFCLQQAGIPALVMQELMKKIEHNNAIVREINISEAELSSLEDKIEEKAKNKIISRNGSRSGKDPKKLGKDISDTSSVNNVSHRCSEKIHQLTSLICNVSLNDTFIPNKQPHQKKWVNKIFPNAFTCNLDSGVVAEIMALHGVDNLYKILLLMGIGVFRMEETPAYMEIIKRLATEERLFMIIATSDYIYGTNYQFCHGFIGKDLVLSQEKITQCLGRIGRGNIQQKYTARFRDNQHIRTLFSPHADRPEAANMNMLFCE